MQQLLLHLGIIGASLAFSALAAEGAPPRYHTRFLAVRPAAPLVFVRTTPVYVAPPAVGVVVAVDPLPAAPVVVQPAPVYLRPAWVRRGVFRWRVR